MTHRQSGPVQLTRSDWQLATAVCGDETATTAAWAEWSTTNDVDGTPDHSYPFLVALGGRNVTLLPGDDTGRLRGLHRRNWYVVQRLQTLAVATTAALHSHGAGAVLFGPLAVAASVGGEPGWRHTTGADLLIGPNQMDTALEALTRLGLRVTRRPSRRPTSVAVLSSADGLTLRVHRLLPHVGMFGSPDDGPWRRRSRLQVTDRHVDVLSVPDLLVLATAPRLGWMGDDAVWPLDVHRLVLAHGGHEAWQEVVDAAASTPWGPAMASALAQCRDHLDTPVPDEVLERLERLPRPSRLLRAEQHARRMLGRVRSPARPRAVTPDAA